MSQEEKDAAFKAGKYTTVWYQDDLIRERSEWFEHKANMEQDAEALERICDLPLGIHSYYSRVSKSSSLIVAGDGKYHDSFASDQRDEASKRLDEIRRGLSK
ncbi:MAG TPA: hypothetical protein VNT79_06990 [Phycisphaerae bacterium]|nr:hypothetical protein [Phycisphaerae bacterium]